MASKLNIKALPLIAGLLFLALTVSGLIIYFQLAKPLAPLRRDRTRLTIDQAELSVEVVTKPVDLYRGLSGRASLCSDCGMLFVFPDLAPRTFVMREMNFPLDIIFLADDLVVNIAKNLAPEGKRPEHYYQSGQPANRVLEVNAGYCDRVGIDVGDTLIFKAGKFNQ